MAARKTSEAPTRIWKFSARPTDESLVHGVLRQANRYYNELVSIERDRHQRYQEIRRRFAPELAALEEEWERLDDEAGDLIREQKRLRQEHWRESGEARRLLSEQIDARIKSLDAEKRRVSAAAKEHRATFNALLVPAREEYTRRTKELAGDAGPRTKSIVNAQVLDEMLGEDWAGAWKDIVRSDDKAHRLSLAARATCGLATGTYLQVEDAFQRAKKDSLPRPPRFRRFDGSGKVTVQVRDAAFADAMTGTTALTISPAPHSPNKRGDQSQMAVVRLDQSIPRGEKRQVVMTVKLHRRPPEDAAIKWASLFVRRIGARTVYELQLTLEHPSFAEPKRPAGLRASEHVSIGWARLDHGVRVAHWSNGEVVVPNEILAQHEHAASIEGAADRHFDRAKRLLRRWMRFGPHRLTAWHRMHSDHSRGLLRYACTEFARSRLDIRNLWHAWKTDRLSRGEDLYAPSCVQRRWLASRGIVNQHDRAAFWAYTWARKDEHLCQLTVDSRRRFAARRDAHYRAEAIRIATEFSSVTVDGFKISALKELPLLTMPGDPPRDQAQHNAQAAAPGKFRELLQEVMGGRCTPCDRSSGDVKAAGSRKRKAAKNQTDTMTGENDTKNAAE